MCRSLILLLIWQASSQTSTQVVARVVKEDPRIELPDIKQIVLSKPVR